jgi:hypothetical protein
MAYRRSLFQNFSEIPTEMGPRKFCNGLHRAGLHGSNIFRPRGRRNNIIYEHGVELNMSLRVHMATKDYDVMTSQAELMIVFGSQIL